MENCDSRQICPATPWHRLENLDEIGLPKVVLYFPLSWFFLPLSYRGQNLAKCTTKRRGSLQTRTLSMCAGVEKKDEKPPTRYRTVICAVQYVCVQYMYTYYTPCGMCHTGSIRAAISRMVYTI